MFPSLVLSLQLKTMKTEGRERSSDALSLKRSKIIHPVCHIVSGLQQAHLMAQHWLLVNTSLLGSFLLSLRTFPSLWFHNSHKQFFLQFIPETKAWWETPDLYLGTMVQGGASPQSSSASLDCFNLAINLLISHMPSKDYQSLDVFFFFVFFFLEPNDDKKNK